MINNLTNDLAILDVGPELFGKRTLFGIVVGSLLGRKHNVHRRTLAGKDLCAQALLVQVDNSAVDLVEQERGDDAVDLQGELGRFDDVQTTDQGVDDNGQAAAIVDGNGIGLVVDLDDGFVAARYENGVGPIGGDFDDFTRVVKVFDNPFFAFKFLARRLATAHVLGLGFLAWRWGPGTSHAILGAGAIARHGRAGTEIRVLMCHLRLVNLAQAGRYRIALVQFIKDGRHIWCRTRGGRRRRRRSECTRRRGRRRGSTTRHIERWNRRGRGRRGCCVARAGTTTLDLLQGFLCINSFPIIPGQTIGIMLLEICHECFEYLGVCLDILDVRAVPVGEKRLGQLSSICFLPKASRLLFLVFLYDFVAVVLNTTNHFVDEISGLGLEKPPQRNNSLRDSAEMTEEG